MATPSWPATGSSNTCMRQRRACPHMRSRAQSPEPCLPPQRSPPFRRLARCSHLQQVGELAVQVAHNSHCRSLMGLHLQAVQACLHF